MPAPKFVVLDSIEDCSALAVGDPVRLTKGDTQINTLVQDAHPGGVMIEGFWLSIEDGWKVQRPRVVPPLPTESGSIVAAVDADPEALYREREWTLVDGAWFSVGEWADAAELQMRTADWRWVSKPEAIAVPEVARELLSEILEPFDAELAMEGDDEDHLEAEEVREAVATTRGAIVAALRARIGVPR